MLEGAFAPGGTASEVSIPGYKLAGKTGTANKIDPATGEYSKFHYIASFMGFAPALHPKLLIGVMVDEPQGAIYGGVGRRAGLRQDRLLRPAVHAHPAAIGCRGVLLAERHRLRRARGRGHGARLRQPPRDAGHAVLLRAGLHARRPRLRRRRDRARRGGARRAAPAGHRACPRSSSTTCAPRWRPPPPRWPATRPRG